MKCFNHNDRDAVGLCKACGRALCSDCLTELEHSVVCTGRCEERGRQIEGVLDHSIRTVANTKTFSLRGFLFPFLAGLVFLVFGILNMEDMKFSLFLIAVGVLFVMSSAFVLLNLKRLTRSRKG